MAPGVARPVRRPPRRRRRHLVAGLLDQIAALEWIREHIGRYRDAAIDDPTPQNVALYLYLQRVALDKSSRFAAATQRAVQLDPFLDEITRRPTATFAANLTAAPALSSFDSPLRFKAISSGLILARFRPR